MGEGAGICYLQGSLHQAEREAVLSPQSFCALQQFCLLFVFGLSQKGNLQVFSDVSGSSTVENLLCSVLESSDSVRAWRHALATWALTHLAS